MVFENVFKTRLKELRESHNVTMTELADILGMTSSAAISQFETGKSLPSYFTLLKIALFFGVSLEWLTGLSDTPYTKASITAAQKYLKQHIHILNAEAVIKDVIALWRNSQSIHYEKDASIIPDEADYAINGRLIFLMHATFLMDIKRGELLKVTDFIDFLSNDFHMDCRHRLIFRKRVRYIYLKEYYTKDLKCRAKE